MRYLLLTFLLLLPLTAMAGQYEVTSLPDTIFQDDHSVDGIDTITLAGTKVTSTTTGLVFQSLYDDEVCNWILAGNDDTLEFGTASGDKMFGLKFIGTGTYYPYNIKIQDLFVYHNPGTPGDADSTRTIYVRGDSLSFVDVDAIVKGTGGILFEAKGAYIFNNYIEGGTWSSEVTEFGSRCEFDATVVEASSLYHGSLPEAGDYHIEINNLNIDGGPHVGIMVYGFDATNWATVKIHACTVMTDMRNDLYTEYSGLCKSAANAYGIMLARITGKTEVYDNYVYSGTSHGGNRGIYVSSIRTAASDTVKIHDNVVDVHDGPTVEMGDDSPSHGFRARYALGNLEVYDNTFICSVDSASATDDYGLSAHPVRLSLTDDTAQVTIRNNTIIARTLHEGGTTGNGITFDAIDYPYLVTTKYNNITSFGNIYKFGEVNGQDEGHTGITMIGDTVAFGDTTINENTFYIGHLSNNWLCSYNKARDLVYQNGTSDTNIVFSAGGTSDITIQRTLSIYAIGNDGLPVPSAACTTWNDYGQQVLAGSSDMNGLVSGVVGYWYESRADADSTGFNDFIIHVWKDDDVATDSSFTVGSSVAGGLDSLVLTGTGGGKLYQTVKYLGGKR